MCIAQLRGLSTMLKLLRACQRTMYAVSKAIVELVVRPQVDFYSERLLQCCSVELFNSSVANFGAVSKVL